MFLNDTANFTSAYKDIILVYSLLIALISNYAHF